MTLLDLQGKQIDGTKADPNAKIDADTVDNIPDSSKDTGTDADGKTGNEGADNKDSKKGLITQENWKDVLSEQFKNHEKINRIDSLDKLAEQYIESQKMISQSVKIPGTDASPESVREFYKKLGMPETSEEYTLEKPEQMKDLPADVAEGYKKFFAEAAFKANLTKEQANTVYQDYLLSQETSTLAQIDAIKTKEATTKAELQRAWGGDYDTNLKNIGNNITKIFDQETIDILSTQTTLLSDTQFLKRLNNLTKMVSGDTLYIDGKEVANVKLTLSETEAERDRLLSEDRMKHKDRINELNRKIVSLRQSQNARVR